MRSPSTRYGLIGGSFESSHGRNFARNSCLAARISSTRAGFFFGAPRRDSSSESACSVSFASPTTAWRVSYERLRSSVSIVHCTMVFLSASGMAWLKRLGKRLAPIEKSRSHFLRNRSASEPRTPTESGGVSAHAPEHQRVLRARARPDPAHRAVATGAAARAPPPPRRGIGPVALARD